MAKKRVALVQDKVKKGNGVGGAIKSLWGFIAWLTGIIVSLAVGFGMVNGVLIIPYIPQVITESAGWVVVMLVILGAFLSVIDKIKK